MLNSLTKKSIICAAIICSSALGSSGAALAFGTIDDEDNPNPHGGAEGFPNAGVGPDGVVFDKVDDSVAPINMIPTITGNAGDGNGSDAFQAPTAIAPDRDLDPGVVGDRDGPVGTDTARRLDGPCADEDPFGCLD